MNPKLRLNILRALVLVGVIALTFYLVTIRDQVKKLEEYGYIGIFLISILANATIIIPLPGIAITSAMGAIFNPVGVAVAAGAGASLGELSGYLAGFSGRGVVENVAAYDRIVGWMRRNELLSYLVIMVMAFIPNPLFDVAGMAAGTLKMPVWRFLFFCAIGKIFKMLLFAYLGASSVKWFLGP